MHACMDAGMHVFMLGPQASVTIRVVGQLVPFGTMYETSVHRRLEDRRQRTFLERRPCFQA